MTPQPQRRVQISLHVDAELRAQLEEAARRSVRSISGEITYRLQQSLLTKPRPLRPRRKTPPTLGGARISGGGRFAEPGPLHANS